MKSKIREKEKERKNDLLILFIALAVDEMLQLCKVR